MYYDLKPVNFLRVVVYCQIFLVVVSFGMKNLGSNTRLVDALCVRPPFPPRIFRMFSKIAVSLGLTYFVTQKLG